MSSAHAWQTYSKFPGLPEGMEKAEAPVLTVGLGAFVEGAVAWRAGLAVPLTPVGLPPLPQHPLSGRAAESQPTPGGR